MRGQCPDLGNVTTKRVENFSSLLRRDIIGGYRIASKDHLLLYLLEFTLRFNRR
jgi:hypothetical protein